MSPLHTSAALASPIGKKTLGSCLVSPTLAEVPSRYGEANYYTLCVITALDALCRTKVKKAKAEPAQDDDGEDLPQSNTPLIRELSLQSADSETKDTDTASSRIMSADDSRSVVERMIFPEGTPTSSQPEDLSPTDSVVTPDSMFDPEKLLDARLRPEAIRDETRFIRQEEAINHVVSNFF